MNPLHRLREDRARARELNDPYAELCVLATVDSHRNPQARTLVLRDLDERLAVFVNATSPKWPSMDSVAAVVFLASLDIQYRLQCRTEPVAAETVQASWQLRPEIPKRLDWLYEKRPQSSVLRRREQLLAELTAAPVPDPLVAPDSARGLYLVPEAVERLDVKHDSGIHDRRRWTLAEGEWREQVLVP
ncbi:MAG: hypothetical protein OXE40_08900 [Gammaproteobacteria bacterium]|nr:hypothetical protein [Gammaproteobacteria bacterium]